MNKMSKCIFNIVIILVVACSVLVAPIKAVGSEVKGISQLINEKNHSYSQYAQQIETIMQGLVAQKDLYDSSSSKDLRGEPDYVSTYDLENAYRVFIADNLFLTKLNQSGSFTDILTDKIQWKVPVVTQKGDNGLVTLLEENGKLSWVATEVGEATENLYVSDAKIKNAVEKAKEVKGDFDDMKIAHSYMYNTTFVYLNSDKEEYLIPFSCYFKEIGINNGELYTVSQIQKKFNNCFEEETNVDDSGVIVYGSGPTFKNRNFSFKLALGCSVVIGIIALIIVIKRRKNHNTDSITSEIQ